MNSGAQGQCPSHGNEPPNLPEPPNLHEPPNLLGGGTPNEFGGSRAARFSSRYPRRGAYPVEPPQRPEGRPIRLAVVEAICSRYRVPVYRRLSRHPALEVRLFVGTGLPGSKTVNADDTSGLDLVTMTTFRRGVRSGGRLVPLLFNPTAAWHLWRWKPDVLLMQGGEPFTNLPILVYARLFRRPVIWWSLGELRGRRYTGPSRLYRRLVQFIERRCDIYLGYSSAAIDYFRRMGYPLERCYNTVNVVDTDLVAQQAAAARRDVEPLRRRLGLGRGPIVLYVGAMEQPKRVDRLLRAFRDLHDEPYMAGAHLLLVGDGRERAPLERLADSLGLAGRATFVGAVYEGVGAYFQLADLLVLPGTGGLAVSEAMAHGLPVVCAVGDGCELDLIQDGRTGWVLSDDDPGALSRALRTCLSDADRLREMGRHARRAIDAEFNISRFMNEMFAAVFAACTLRRPG